MHGQSSHRQPWPPEHIPPVLLAAGHHLHALQHVDNVVDAAALHLQAGRRIVQADLSRARRLALVGAQEVVTQQPQGLFLAAVVGRAPTRLLLLLLQQLLLRVMLVLLLRVQLLQLLLLLLLQQLLVRLSKVLQVVLLLQLLLVLWQLFKLLLLLLLGRLQRRRLLLSRLLLELQFQLLLLQLLERPLGRRRLIHLRCGSQYICNTHTRAGFST